MTKFRRDSGFTLIELLIVVAVIGLLLALILPAVQQAREGVRGVQCKSNLRALAQAATQYHDVHNTYPGWRHYDNAHLGNDGMVTSEFYSSSPSVHSRLLPFLENGATYASINWNVPIKSDSDVAPLWLRAVQETVSRTHVRSFVCPSETNTLLAEAPCSYRAAWGVGPLWHQSHLFPDSSNGVFASGSGDPYMIRESFVFDGMSKTIMFSERVLGDHKDEFPSPFSSFVPQGGFEALGAFTADDELRVCAALNNVETARYTRAGRYWLYSGVNHTMYTHVLPPNAAIIDCVSFNYSVPLGAASARSYHPGGVHASFGDGSATFVNQNIALAIWRGLCSRNGGETHPNNL